MTTKAPTLFDPAPRVAPPAPGPAAAPYDIRTSPRNTSAIAGYIAAGRISHRRQQIISHLERSGPSTMIEIALALDVAPNQISGRFSDLVRDRVIELAGDRRRNPKTGCPAEVYRLCQPVTPSPSTLASNSKIMADSRPMSDSKPRS